MGSQAILVGFVLASGFVAAGLLNALHRSFLPIAEDEGFSPVVLSFESGPAIIWSMLVCTFAGPYLVISNGLYFWRMRILPTPALLVCVVLSMIWSFCSGVFMVEGYLLLSQIP